MEQRNKGCPGTYIRPLKTGPPFGLTVAMWAGGEWVGPPHPAQAPTMATWFLMAPTTLAEEAGPCLSPVCQLCPGATGGESTSRLTALLARGSAEATVPSQACSRDSGCRDRPHPQASPSR
jgi:hypothetical protein